MGFGSFDSEKLMNLRILFASGLAALVSIGASAADYDAQLAESYARLFEPVAGAKASKAMHLMTPDQFVKDFQAGKPMLAMDVRTPNEFGLCSMTLPESLTIPLNQAFHPENLQRIPQDKTVVIVCKSGTRATAVGTALRHIGFDNVYVLKGGIMALAKHLSPKTANPPPKVALR
jgi:rhodanese-related sulfurtransferase